MMDNSRGKQVSANKRQNADKTKTGKLEVVDHYSIIQQQTV